MALPYATPDQVRQIVKEMLANQGPQPGPTPTPGEAFIGTLTEDNLLFELDLTDSSYFVNHAPADFTSNHMVVIVMETDEQVTSVGGVTIVTTGWLKEYNNTEQTFKIGTSLPITLGGEDRACTATIIELDYNHPDWEYEDPKRFFFKCSLPDGEVQYTFGNYDNNYFNSIKVYLLK